ncbi:DUF3833 domain-containing protein [Caldimonas sp. KR1-144]|uniref:DUF3833 domain-containing protein n=1 Tax=Caldimonas sp. KR1-144 TaxID=3400911 RepID=UPI003C0462C8
MNLIRRTAAVGAAAFLLAGCAGPGLDVYRHEKPAFDLRSYFDGRVLAHGLVSDRSGKVLRRFTVTMDARWEGDVGTLDEQFVFSDGERQRRVWRLVRGPDGRFSGTADDVVGQAEGAQSGAAFRWRYTLRVPVDGRTWEIDFDDWMFAVDERTVLNRAAMSKWGVRVGEVTLAFTKP